MALEDIRRRLPVVGALPRARDRSFSDADRGPAPRPAIAVWEFTLMCDHRCLHCGPRAGRPRPDELSTEEALELVAELAELGVLAGVSSGRWSGSWPDGILIAATERCSAADIEALIEAMGRLS